MNSLNNIQMTLGELRKVLIEINENKNHTYSEEEVKQIKHIEKELLGSLNNSLNNIQETFDVLNKRFDVFFSTLQSTSEYYFLKVNLTSQKGWYLSPNIVSNYSLLEIEKMISKESIEGFENRLLKDSKCKIEEIINNCSNSFPNRAHFFKEIFDIYNLDYYNSIINLTYSQVDGICNDLWGLSFFDKNQNNYYKLKLFEHTGSGIISIVKDQLNVKINEITQNSKDKSLQSNITSSYNRHLVLHGHSLNYGTKLNAIRAIYLLDFIEYLSKNLKSKLK